MLCVLVLLFILLPSLFAAAYILMMLLIGGVLYWRARPEYIVYTLSLWLITPGIRRLADWNVGAESSDFVMLTPYLVSAISWITVIRYVYNIFSINTFPFLLSSMAVVVSFFWGVIENGLFLSMFSFLKWVVPIGFGLHIALSWRDYPAINRGLRYLFVWGGLCLSLYAIVQFIFLPEWDRQWMTSSGMKSIGLPTPFLVRIFSTMNAPGPYAIYMMIGLIYMLGVPNVGKLGRFAMFIGYPVFLLTLVRSAWGGWLVGAFLLTFMLERNKRVKFFVATIIVAILLGGLVLPYLGAGTGLVADRLASFSRLADDASFLARINVHKQVVEDIFLSPLGSGLGSFGGPGSEAYSETINKYGSFDSGLLEIPYVLGWVGGLIYAWSLVWLTVKLAKCGFTSKDPYLATYGAIVIALLSQLMFGAAHRGVPGVFLWGIIGLAIAGMNYNKNIGRINNAYSTILHHASKH